MRNNTRHSDKIRAMHGRTDGGLFSDNYGGYPDQARESNHLILIDQNAMFSIRDEITENYGFDELLGQNGKEQNTKAYKSYSDWYDIGLKFCHWRGTARFEWSWGAGQYNSTLKPLADKIGEIK